VRDIIHPLPPAGCFNGEIHNPLPRPPCRRRFSFIIQFAFSASCQGREILSYGGEAPGTAAQPLRDVQVFISSAQHPKDRVLLPQG
jgi:hypothetical protein